MSGTDGKTDRLAAALRANLARRKAQARARRATDSVAGANMATLGDEGRQEGSGPDGDARAPADGESGRKERIVSEGEAG